MATMAQVHTAFLQASQQSIAILGQLAGGVVPVAPAMPAVVAAPAPAPRPVAAPVPPPAPIPAPVPPPAPVPVAAPAPVPVAAPVPPPAPAPAPAPIAAPAPVAAPAGLSVEGLTTLLLSVVADKTGYPSEMLAMEMELEGDLGIDSIKRVEILSAMQDEVPSLPEVDTGVMAELVTLGQIVEYMASQMEGGAPAPVPVGAAASNGAGIDRYTLEAVETPKAEPRQRG